MREAKLFARGAAAFYTGAYCAKCCTAPIKTDFKECQEKSQHHPPLRHILLLFSPTYIMSLINTQHKTVVSQREKCSQIVIVLSYFIVSPFSSLFS